MRADHFSPDTQEFLHLLARHSVRYLIIGGTAVIYHGYARLTGDVDFFYDRAPENVERLWKALLEFWDGSVPGVESKAELAEPDLVLQFGRPPNRIDLMSSIGAPTFADAWEHRVHESITTPSRTIPVWILSLADLRTAKKQAGRPKDMDDLENLPDESS